MLRRNINFLNSLIPLGEKVQGAERTPIFSIESTDILTSPTSLHLKLNPPSIPHEPHGQ